MNFDWEDYLKLAEALQLKPNIPGPCEASLRTATSRAYYAAFRCAIGFARSEGFQESYTGSDHGDIRKHFREHQPNNKNIRSKISVDLDRMYDNRRKVDYHDELKTTSPNALAYSTIKMAQNLLNNLKSLKNNLNY